MANTPVNDAPYRLLTDVAVGDNVFICSFVNLYGCRIGANTRVGPFVEIQRGVVIGCNCKIQSHTFICEGVAISDGVFVGHGVMFINDKYPHATADTGLLQTDGDWELLRTRIERDASLGSGCVILGGISVGERAIIGAGAVVSRDVAAGAVVAGVPARTLQGSRRRSSHND